MYTTRGNLTKSGRPPLLDRTSNCSATHFTPFARTLSTLGYFGVHVCNFLPVNVVSYDLKFEQIVIEVSQYRTKKTVFVLVGNCLFSVFCFARENAPIHVPINNVFFTGTKRDNRGIIALHMCQVTVECLRHAPIVEQRISFLSC